MPFIIKHLGLQPYETTWEAMQAFTNNRTPDTQDELWVVQHPPVFTQGLNGKAEHLLNNHPTIPLVQTDRGGQVTYHAPGQLIIYILMDLKRARLGAKDFVHRIENALIALLKEHYQLSAEARADAPGVYVDGKKIASLGLKIRQFRSYHGLALNVDMDLEPFHWINPCGLVGMEMTQLSEHANEIDYAELENQAIDILRLHLSNTN